MIQEKKKQASKPSERIKEIIAEEARDSRSDGEFDRIDAIIEYLDERWERSQERGKNRKADK